MSNDRVLDLEGVHNFRDYGGYATRGGGRLKRGVLWRSGQHVDATDADLAKIGELGLARVYDLRSSHERSCHPCRRPEGFAGEVHFAEDPGRREAPHIAAAMTPRRRDAESTRAGMVRNYASIAYRPELIAMMKRYLAGLCADDSASLVNCMAGKDRTGITVAMLHFAVGVHPDDVLADYLLTNTAGDIEARIAAGMKSIRATAGEMDEAAMRVLMGVEPEWFAALVSRLEAEHGSVDGYLREVLELDDAARDRLRAVLVEY